MKTSEVKPLNVESPFERDEMFFSTTDTKGRLISYNEIFVRTSKYSKEELKGKSHNIVRHPDMPKVIFKLLWDYILSGKPIVAYVKNMAKDGSYYWVLATVLPIFDDEGKPEKFLSIRIKPETEYFQIIKKLYKKLLLEEESGGIEASLKLLQKEIQKLGFKSYDYFMKKILDEELTAKQNILNVEFTYDPNFPENLQKIYEVFTGFKQVQQLYEDIYEFSKNFEKVGKLLKEHSKDIYSLSDDIRLISLNSSVESYKLGESGNSFFVLSTEMRKTAEKSGKAIKDMEKIINRSLEYMDEITFSMSISKLAIFMINKFLAEILCGECRNKNIDKSTILDIMDNYKAIKFQILKMYNLSKELDKNLKKAINTLSSLRYLIKRLHFLYLSGMVESAHQTQTNFSIIFLQINKLVECTKKTIDILSTNVMNTYEDNKVVKKDFEDILVTLDEIKNTVQNVSIQPAS